VASEIKLDCIEFILDFNDAENNPLLKEGGLDEIKSISDKTDVLVRTICADYFMEAPLHSADTVVSEQSQEVLIRLLNSAAAIGVTDVVVPCVDQSSLNEQVVLDRFVEKLTPVIDLAEKHSINLSLETDLAPQQFLELLERFNSNRVTVNYDIGNSASLGFDPVEELNAYGNRITDIHIKDRELGGGPVFLGHGSANFNDFFNQLSVCGYQCPLHRDTPA
jgi:sugar phosphate isomerase/epimerase